MPTDVKDSYKHKGNLHGYPKVFEELVLTGKRCDRNSFGKLVLRDLPLQRRYDKCMYSFASNQAAAAELNTISETMTFDGLPFNVRASALSESYARLRGKIYKGSASLGVTVATYGQSRAMIADRYNKLNQSAASYISKLSRVKSKKKLARLLASLHLEVKFGWAPLVADILATAKTVIQQAIPPTFISVRVRKFVDIQQTWKRSRLKITESSQCIYTCTRSAKVEISNPNLWLSERAGSLNLAAVAWDLVPWSFVVNMFTNVGQIVNSITDFVGLTFPTSSLTETIKGAGSCIVVPNGATGYARSRFVRKLKSRSMNGLARPPLTFKLPGANWETAAMLASLFTQKLGVLSKLIK